MLYAEINHTNLRASKLVLGTDTFGTQVSEQDAFALLDCYVGAGGNMIDTASVYADWLGKGKSISEKTIGKWLVSRGCRDKVIISTKGGHHDLTTLSSRLNLKSIQEDFENSLNNLQTDRIDIYWLHKDDPNQEPEAMIEILNEAVSKDGARYLGVSNWTYDRIKRANTYAQEKSLRPIIASQIQHSIAKLNKAAYGITAMDEVQYEKYSLDDLNVFAFSSQAKGFFAIMEKGGEAALPEKTKQMFWNERNLERFHRLKTMAQEKNVPIPALVIAALVCDEKVNTFAQIGPRTLTELDSSLEEANLRLTQEERIYLLGTSNG